MRKSFVILIVGAVVWGVSLGLAFIGGVALGANQPDDAAITPVSAQGPQGQFDPAQRDDVRRRIQSGEISQEELNQLRQRQGQGDGRQRLQGGDGSGFQGGQRPQDGGGSSSQEGQHSQGGGGSGFLGGQHE